MNLFGRNYDSVGSSNSDFLIKTKGFVKIQWGSKFIDIIKDGKVNADSDFIFTVSNKDEIGTKNGIYVTDNSDIYLRIENNILPISSSSGNTYVSFLEEQKTNADQKYQALKNIGLVYSTLEEVPELKNGIVYIEGTNKIYTVLNGKLTEYNFKFPSSINQKFTISKSDNNKGSLIIEGSGIENSLKFDSLYIYEDSNYSYIKSDKSIKFNILDNDIITIDSNITKINNTLSTNNVISDNFRLYNDGIESYLEVDNIIVKNGLGHPGYYYNTYESTNGLTYLGINEVEATEDHPYIYYTNDGRDYQLVKTLGQQTAQVQKLNLKNEIITFDNSIWNLSTVPDNCSIWKINEKNVILGKPSDYIEADITIENWKSEQFRKCFLEFIFSEILTKNKDNYSEEMFWDLSSAKKLTTIGISGYCNAKISDTNILSTVNLQIISDEFIIYSVFKNVKLGKLLPYKFGNKSYNVGDILTENIGNLYNIDYETCNYKIITNFN